MKMYLAQTKILFTCKVILFFYLIINSAVAISETKSVQVVDTYMKSLIIGDLTTIEGCLGQEMIMQFENILTDKNYSNFLAERYNGATYVVLSEEVTQNGIKEVDVEITFSYGGTMTKRFLVDHQNKIIDEVNL